MRTLSMKMDTANLTREDPPALTLPAELLTRIFKSCLCVCLPQCSYPCGQPHLEVSHVCRYWREVALNSAALWSAFNPSSPDMAATMLTRSKTLPLRVHLLSPRCGRGCAGYRPDEYKRCQEAESTLRTVLGAVARVHSLHVNINRQRYMDAFLVLAQARYPSLQTLSLASCVDSGHDREAFVLPDQIIGEATSSLRALALDGVSIASTSPLLRNLRSLYLSNGRAGHSQFIALCTALENLPSLEDLHIVDYAKSLNFIPTLAQARPVHLAALKHLHLSEMALTAIPFIRSLITVPPSAIEDIISAESLPEDSDILTTLLSALFLRTREADIPVRLGLDIDGYVVDEDEEDDGSAPVSVGLWRNVDGAGPPSLNMLWFCHACHFPDFLEDAHGRALAQNLQVFELTGSAANLSEDWWKETCRNMSNVHTLVLGVSETAAECLGRLRWVDDDDAPLLPRLSVLVVQQTAIYPAVSAVYSRDAEVEAGFWEEALADVCRFRTRIGVPLREIRVEGCPWIDVGLLRGRDAKPTVVMGDENPVAMSSEHWRYIEKGDRTCSWRTSVRGV